MSEAFNFAIRPFDRLTEAERDKVNAALDLAYYPKDTTILRAGETADCLHVITRGVVQERQGADVLAVYARNDVFDAKSLLGTVEGNNFVAHEDTWCFLVPRALLIELARENAAFGDFYYTDISDKLRVLAADSSNRETSALMMARIRQAYIHPPFYVDSGASIREAAVVMKGRKATSLLVRDVRPDGSTRTGIVTGIDIREAVILGDVPVTAPVGPLASYDLLTLQLDDLLFNAVILMARHAVRRIVILDGNEVAGVLEQVDLLSFLSNHSQIISIQVDRATTPAELAKASADMLGLIRTLHGTGVKGRFIAELVTALNRRLFRKLFDLLAPPDLVANSCLIVMGSEGRGEQILKTDQDNGLILRDGYQCPDLESVTAAFTKMLIEFGYPACPGNIMVSNPVWTRSVQGYRDAIHDWIHRRDEAAQLNLAIFYDAEAVAGDMTLLTQAKGYLLARMSDNQAFFSHFARPALSFDTPSGLFASLFSERGAKQSLDIKKAAIFPLVHGIRSLALERRMTETNTLDRIWALSEAGVLDRSFATELADAFAFLQEVRLKARIHSDPAASGIDNIVRLDKMSKLDRDQFKDILQLIKRFKEFISYHFHLAMY